VKFLVQLLHAVKQKMKHSYMRSDRTSPSPASSSLAERIRNEMDSFTPTEKRAAHLLLSHYPFAGLNTVAEFASRAGISAPSALRFVTRLGFSGFPEFQRHLRGELEAQLLSPLAKSGPHELGQHAPALAAFAEATIGNLRSTVENIAPAEFDAVVSLLSDHRRLVHFTGGRFTGAIARYAESHFRIVRSHVDFIEGQPALWRDRVIEIGKKDVIVAFDIRRYQEDVVALCETAAKQGATVVLLTDPWLSPIARVAQHVLPAHIAAPSNWDSSAGLLLLTEALVGAVTKRLWDSARPRMEAIERLRDGGD
jgi:DNA-binding MurR/RpiR family transcriptional regulator